MKKYAVMVLAVMLMSVMASGAWARFTLMFSGQSTGYVGEELDAAVKMTTLGRHVSVSVGGQLPPGCHYEIVVNDVKIKGKPTEEGTYTFNVSVTGENLMTELYEEGFDSFTIRILPARNTDGGTGDDTGNNTGDNTGNDTNGNTDGDTGDKTGGNTDNNNGNMSFEDWLKRNGNTYNNDTGDNGDNANGNTGNNTGDNTNNNGQTDNGDDNPEGVSGSGGGGGCNSGLAILALATLVTLRKSRS